MASTMAATAQDSTAPLRGPGGEKSKDEDREEESKKKALVWFGSVLIRANG
jgi:hypothetical protein